MSYVSYFSGNPRSDQPQIKYQDRRSFSSNDNSAAASLFVPGPNAFDCNDRRFKCAGPGLFPDPSDKTIFYRCKFKPKKNRFGSTCFPCNEKYLKCFNINVQACLPCDDVNLKRYEVKEIISQTTSYDCYGYEAFPCSQMGYGLHEHPGDRSITVDCRNDTTNDGEWIGGCKACNKEKFSCFIEQIGQCIENCVDGIVHLYDCSQYKIDPDIPCREIGKFGLPGRNTTYFECAETPAGSGKLRSRCVVCPRKSFFNRMEKKCIQPPEEKLEARVIDLRPTGPTYDCSPFNESSYPCIRPGFYANPNDTSVYFSCWPLPSGGFASLCYTCNKLYKTCYDDLQKACVTVGNNETCSTTLNLQNRTDKGTPGSSRTFSCEGYNNLSFPCKSYKKGDHAMPGDISVYVHCEDVDNDLIPDYASCHECEESTDGCFNENLKKCVNYCRGKLNSTQRAPMPLPTERPRKNPPTVITFPSLTYDCKRASFICLRAGVFANPNDPSIYFVCKPGRRPNDWAVKCLTCPKFTCFDARARTCTVACRRIKENWKYMMCRDYWIPECNIMLGI